MAWYIVQSSRTKCAQISSIAYSKWHRRWKYQYLIHQLDYYKQDLAARVRLLLARSRTQIRKHSFYTAVQTTAATASSPRWFQAERLLFLRICHLGEGIPHIFTSIMRYFNPLQHLTFTWLDSRSAPLIRSGGLCTSTIRRSIKRKTKHPTNAGKRKRSRLKLQRNKIDHQNNTQLYYVNLNSNKKLNRYFQQGQKQKQKQNNFLSLLSVIKTNIVWELLCRTDDKFMSAIINNRI